MSFRSVQWRWLWVAVAVLAGGCSTRQYSPRPLDPEATASEYTLRSAGADGLRRFAAANGYPDAVWPPAQWGLRELTLAALYFHPDIRTARARAAVARAEMVAAGRPQLLQARLKPEHHSRVLPEDEGPWSLGLELEIPLVAQGRRRALEERGVFFVDAADIDVAMAGWNVRSRMRDRLLDLQSSLANLDLLMAQLAARTEMLALVTRRVETGMLSARDLGIERVAVAQLEFARDQEAVRRDRALGELAAAIGLPLDVLHEMKMSFTGIETPAIESTDSDLRALALRNRLDVHRRLLEFGAADADVKFAVAAQNPEIALGPGYMWDQGGSVWSLALGVSLPSAARANASIREAEARRELAAQRFMATQFEAIGRAETATAQYRSVHERVASAQRQAKFQQEQEARMVRQFDAGAADRLQRVAVRIETLAAQAALQAARAESRRALAELEDAVQRPLFGDFDILPDVRAPLSSGVPKK